MATNNHPRIFVIEINNFDENEHEILLYSSIENALAALAEDIADRYHFDTDEPYCTPEELEQKREDMRKSLTNKGYWADGSEEYYLDEKEVW